MSDLKEILAAATPGPWFCDEDPRVGMEWNIHVHYTIEDRICFMSNMGTERVGEVSANARLIAMAPDLAAEVLRLRAEVERLTGDAANVRKKAFTEAMAAISDQRCGANWNAISTAISEIQKLMKEPQ